ncbi:iron complex transport system substrate-binding protein [Lachnospiraceae bacterium C7]|nr:iron complex transport system substrate-binding protein [Lachnospiraceae bacterium C7]
MNKKAKSILTTLAVATLATNLLMGCGASNSQEKKESTEKVKIETNASKEKDSNYKPVTITLNLNRSGLGKNVEYTFKKAPTKAVASGDQMANILFDLGLSKNMVGYTQGSCMDDNSSYEGRDKVKQLAKPGTNLTDVSKEKVVDTKCDFLIGWDSVFSDDHFSVDFCKKNGIAPYFPYVCSDKATMDDLYKDYETLGKIFDVEDVANEKITTMKTKLEKVKNALGDEAYKKPVKVFVYDSGEDAPFTACQGMPGDILKRAGAVSAFDEIKKGWATVSWEEVVAKEPEAILILDYGNKDDVKKKEEFLKNNEYTKNLKAVKEGKIYSVNCANMQGSAGSAQVVENLAKQLYPNKF